MAVNRGYLPFQSTRPRGARHAPGAENTAGARFNPRAHAGRDLSNLSRYAPPDRFNPRAHAGRDKIRLIMIIKK